MLVKEIIKKVANYTGNFELYEAIKKDVFTEQQQQEINLLVDCVNLTNSNIAANYVKLYDTVEINNTSGTILFSKVSNKTIYQIITVKNSNNFKIDYSLTNNGILAEKGKLYVTYSYFPDNVEYNNSITNYQIKINERNFVYGVIAEYLYVKGVFDEAQIWEEKFKLEMKNLMKSQRSILLKQRRWR